MHRSIEKDPNFGLGELSRRCPVDVEFSSILTVFQRIQYKSLACVS